MKYCKKCNNPINPEHETDHGLCLSCYHEYLLDKIEHLGEKQPKVEETSCKFFKKIQKIIKNFFKQ